MMVRVMVVAAFGVLGYFAWGAIAQEQPVKLEEVSGMITGTDRKGDDVSLRLRSFSKTYTVQVGSLEFLEKQNLILDTGQMITVKGAMSGDTIVAHEIKKGDQIVTLRNEKGDPIWAGKAPVDPNRVVLKGKITKLERRQGHLIATIQTEANESIRVDLGSEAFLNERSIHLAEGGALEVQAIRSTSDAMPLTVATEIHHEGKVFALPGHSYADEFAHFLGGHVKPLGAWAADSEYNKQFKSNQPAQAGGTIQDIVSFLPAPDSAPGVALILSTPQGPMTCHLGPVWYIRHQGLALKKGDPVSCTGSMAAFQGQNVLLVSQLTRGNEILMIRDPQGVPCFAAYREVGQ